MCTLRSTLQHIVYCSVFVCVAVRCSALHHKIAHAIICRQCRHYYYIVHYSTVLVVAICCSVLQCVAVCCSVLQCVAVCCSVFQYAVVCCSLLQCVAHEQYTVVHDKDEKNLSL